MTRKKEQPKAKTVVVPTVKTPRKKVYFFTFNNKKYSLTAQQKLFCDFFLTRGIKAADAVVKAGYDLSGSKDKDLTARQIASQNSTNPKIVAYLKKNIGQLGLNDETVSKTHAELLDDENSAARSKGIDMYYKIHGSYVADRSEAKVNEELADALQRIRTMLPD